MTEAITFSLFQESDAQQVVDLLNRNRFYLGEIKKVTVEEYLYVQKGRGMLFSAVAKDQGKVIGMLAAYQTSGQKVAKKYQVFLGTMVLDLEYRLSYKVFSGLHDEILKEIVSHGFLEILSEVNPQNKQSLHVLLKYGFVVLDDSEDIFGYLTLHNYYPAILKLAGTQNIDAYMDEFFASLPPVNKSTMLKPKQRIHDKYIEYEYYIDKQKIFLWIDVANVKADGIHVPDQISILPDIEKHGDYIVSNLSTTAATNLAYEVINGNDVDDLEQLSVMLNPGETTRIENSQETTELRFTLLGRRCHLFPTVSMDEKQEERTTEILKEGVTFLLDHLTGFVSIYSNEPQCAFITIMWPCVSMPYLEGAIASRYKELDIDVLKDGYMINEETAEYTLCREIKISQKSLTIETRLKLKSYNGALEDIKPLSHIWVDRKVDSCLLSSTDEQHLLSPSLLNPRNSHFIDCSFWEPALNDEDPSQIRTIDLQFGTSTIGIVVDEHCRSIVHIPTLEFHLAFNTENAFDEQVVEKAEIILDREDYYA
jgi:hypothetical protein